MFEKFTEIRTLAECHEALGRASGQSEIDLGTAILRLPLDDRHELIGIVLFGREYHPVEGDDTFAEYRGWLKYAKETPVIVDTAYLVEKPLAEYIRNAEQKLRGEWPKQPSRPRSETFD
jgi:hypothetical protein